MNAKFSNIADMEPPRKRTKASAIASGNRVLAGAEKAKEAFHDVDVFTTELWYHDKIKHQLCDLAHQISNVLKTLWSWIFGSIADQTKFPDTRQAYSRLKNRRFPELWPNSKNKLKRPKWRASAKDIEQIDSLPKHCKVHVWHTFCVRHTHCVAFMYRMPYVWCVA